MSTGLEIAISVVSVLGGMALVFLVFRRSSRFLTDRLIRRIGDLEIDLREGKSSRVVPLLKKVAIQKMGPKTFYYLDGSQVKDLYPQVFQEPEPRRIQTRERKGFKAGISGKFPAVEPKFEGGKAREVTKYYVVEQGLATMYNKVEQFFFDTGGVIFGLDEFEWDQSEIDDFHRVCDEMKSKFDLEIADDQRASYVLDKMRKFALDKTKKLASSSGYVALQNEFVVLNTAGDDCILFYAHPLSEHLLPEDPQVRIQIGCSRSFMTPSGIAAFKKTKSVKITCLGKVVSWDDKNNTLEVNPIAIY